MEILGIIAGIAVFALIVWLLFVVPAQMAEERGRSQLGWVLISLFCSPFAAIIGLLVLGDAPKHSVV